MIRFESSLITGDFDEGVDSESISVTEGSDPGTPDSCRLGIQTWAIMVGWWWTVDVD